jgi:hypothetical protein
MTPPFDPQAPVNPVEIVYAGETDVIVDLGTELFVDTKNCRVDLAYVPCFFSKKMRFDCIFVGNKEEDPTSHLKYEQMVYPIWTKGGNGTAVLKVNGSIDPLTWKALPLPAELGGPLEFPNSGGRMEYRYVSFEIDMDDMDEGTTGINTYCRYAPELIGFYIRYKEIDEAGAVSNPNSVPGEPFNVTWTSGTPGDPNTTGAWQDYIQSVNVSLGLDGSSATIVLDKYGIAGWDAKPNQLIGAITIDVSGGPYSGRGGRIFSGLAFGVGDSGSPDSNTWTIQCYGLEKKLQEVALILPPFFDGMTVDACTSFLCRYGGVNRDFSHFGSPSQTSVKLGGSTRPEAPKYNFSTGTMVADALNETMNNSIVSWICQPDGKVYFYLLDLMTGLPLQPHADYSGDHPYSKIMSVDKQPDFEDLRNEIVVLALRELKQNTGMTPDTAPTMPFMKPLSNRDIVPKIPWSKAIVQPFKGVLDEAEMTQAIDRLKATVSRFDIMGKTQITGDARIWPYSLWGTGVVVSSVSHSIDLVGKTWTTDLEFTKSGH